MKKLLIAAGVAASFAIGAWADGASVAGGEIVSGINFNNDNFTEGDVLDISKDDDGGTEGSRYWTSDENEAMSVISNKTEGASDKYLALNESANLYRWMKPITTDANDYFSVTNESIYFAADVQFTASSEESMANSLSGDDKLLVWLRELDNDDGVTTTRNLIITAGGSGGEVTDFVVSNYNVEPQTWYKLIVKANEDTTGIKFTVLLGEVGATDTGMTVLASGEGEAAVSEFASLVQGGTMSKTISRVGFKGSGALDNLEFGTYQLAQETYFGVGNNEYSTFEEAVTAATAAGGTVVLLQDFDVGSDSLTIDDDAEVVLDLAGRKITSDTADPVIKVLGKLTIINSTETIGSVEQLGEGDAALYAIYISATGTLTIRGGKYYGLAGSSEESPIQDESQDEETSESTTKYFIGDTTTEAELVPEDDTEESTYWVLRAVEGPDVITVTAAVSLATATAELDETKTDPADYCGTISFTFTKAGEEGEEDEIVMLEEDTDYTLSWDPETVTEAGTYTLTVSPVDGSDWTFTPATARLTITEPVAVTLESIAVTTPPTKTAYSVGDTFNPDGMVVTATYSDETTADVSGWTFSPNTALTAADTTITISYTEGGVTRTATVAITVSEVSRWPVAWNNNVQPPSMKNNFDAWVEGNDTTAENAEAAFLLGVNVSAYTDDLTFASIVVDEADGKVTLTGNYNLKEAHGEVKVKSASTLEGLETAVPAAVTVGEDGSISLDKGDAPAQFYELVVGYPAE